ncbi:hypothetical protein ACGFYV_20185 [Streptomyces sp. NPDC048297]|uniref:hypothetical protein n=1 Tax=Streptomyces sp. NPDC048297 TaxID=3365531 RepID=UPI003724C0E9
MSAQHAKRLFAVSVVGALMAGGSALGAAGTASAATPVPVPSYSQRSNRGCDEVWGDGGCDVHGDLGGELGSDLGGLSRHLPLRANVVQAVDDGH